MIVSICITALVLPAVLIMLLSVLVTRCYTMAVPQGQNAMGLALPFLALIAAAGALLLATLLTFVQGTPWWVGQNTPAPRLFALAIAVGTGMASVGTLIAWMERWGSWVPPASLITAIAGPALLGGVLLAAAWKPLPQLHAFSLHRALAPALGIIAISGYAMIAIALLGTWKQHQANQQRVAASESLESQERSRRRSLTPVEALQEDFAQMSDQAPLWVFIARLPDEPDPALRAMIVERSLRVPDLSEQISATLSDNHPRYRHGTLMLILATAPESRRSDWAPSLREAIELSARQIAADPSWLSPDSFSNPDPVGHVQCMALAAHALAARDESLANALPTLRSTIAAATSHPQTATCLKAIDEAAIGSK